MQIENGTINFVVINPNTNSAVPANKIRSAISGEFMSIIHGLTINIPAETGEKKDDSVDWPLILGVSLAGAFIIAALFALICT